MKNSTQHDKAQSKTLKIKTNVKAGPRTLVFDLGGIRLGGIRKQGITTAGPS